MAEYDGLCVWLQNAYPLQYSANKCATALLSHGADHTMTCYAGVTALLWAKWVIPPLVLCMSWELACCLWHAKCCQALHIVWMIGLVPQLSFEFALTFVTIAHACHGLLGLPQNGDDVMYALLESKGAHFNTRNEEGLALLHKAVQVAAGCWHL